MENNVVLFEKKCLESFKKLGDLKKEQDRLAEIEKSVRTEIEAAMDEYDVQSVKNEYVTISRTAASETTSVDLKALEEKEPDLYNELLEDYPKTTTRKASIRIVVK